MRARSLLAAACVAWLSACQPRPPDYSGQRELAGVDDTETSAAGPPADEIYDQDRSTASTTHALRLTAIVKAGAKRTAMLEDESGNGHIVSAGDRIGDYRVVRIAEDHVLLRPTPQSGEARDVRLVMDE